jgi:adenosylcobinamide-phosphate synthase
MIDILLLEKRQNKLMPISFEELHNIFIDPERIPIAVMALMLCAIIGIITGPMHGNANPFYWKFMNVSLGKFGTKLDRIQRSSRDLILRGLVLTILCLLLSFFVGSLLSQIVKHYESSVILEIFFLSLVLSSGTVWYSLLKLYFALSEQKLNKGAYYSIAVSTRVNLNNSDNFGITRIGMGYAARSFDKAIVAPIIWYLIAGLPAAYIYSGLAAIAWRFGKDGFSKGFGKVPLALEKLMGFVPSMFSGALIASAGLFTPTGGMTRAFIALFKSESAYPYEQGSYPLVAMSNSLDIGLGGPVTDVDGSSINNQWIGPESASAKLDSSHLRRAIYIILMAYLIFIVSLMSCIFYAKLTF